jgi:hypothetical protein
MVLDFLIPKPTVSNFKGVQLSIIFIADLYTPQPGYRIYCVRCHPA